MEWLDFPTVKQLHDEVALIEVGPKNEPAGFRPGGEGALEGALERPYNHFYYEGKKPLSYFAAIYLVAIAKAHAFQQGNKRTALLSMRQFLKLNGQPVTIAFPSSRGVEDWVYEITEHGAQELGDPHSPFTLKDVALSVEQFSE